jgi:thioredoxin-dependent peroxiredoxin
MRLTAPIESIDIDCEDIYGDQIKLSDYKGKKVILCFFRNAGCPFCHFRIYELTNKYKEFKGENVEIIAVFSSNKEEVRQHVAKYPRPFRIVADPDLTLYNKYGVEHSGKAFALAAIFKLHKVIKAFFMGAHLDRKNKNPILVPADFLINSDGYIDQVWYGRDTSDHIPMEQVMDFIRT